MELLDAIRRRKTTNGPFLPEPVSGNVWVFTPDTAELLQLDRSGVEVSRRQIEMQAAVGVRN